MFWYKVLARIKRVLASRTCSRKNVLAVDGRLRREAPIAANVSGLGPEQRIQSDMSELDAEPDLLLAWSRSPSMNSTS